MQSIDSATPAGYAANSRYFLPLLPGIFAGWILSGGHEGNEKVASAICWMVERGWQRFTAKAASGIQVLPITVAGTLAKYKL
jgi:hypothetical protein